MGVRGMGLLRAVLIGVASAVLGVGWRGYVFGVVVIIAFCFTDWIAEERVDQLRKRIAKAIRGGVTSRQVS